MVQYGTNSDEHLTGKKNHINMDCYNIKGTFGWLPVGYDEVICGYALYLYQDQLSFRHMYLGQSTPKYLYKI